MKAVCLTAVSPKLTVSVTEVLRPKPGPGELLIRVHAAGVTPTELDWYPTTHTPAGEARSSPVLGHEFSGTIAALGADVDAYRVGDEVYGMNDWFAEGATAEFCLAVPAHIATKPTRLSHAEAAAVPIGALTAWQGLLDRARVRAGERVLIHGGAGAVGLFAVQLARRAGAQVITTASARQTDFLRGLGAADVIDYHTGHFETQAGRPDVIFDCVGGETLRRSWDLLAPGGRLITIAASSEDTQDERTKAAFFIVAPDHHQLAEIARLLDAGELQVFVDAAVPMADAPAAYLGQTPRPSRRGKVVVSVID